MVLLLNKMKFCSNAINLYTKHNGLKNIKTAIRFNYRTFASEKLSPFVSHPYSYAFGRSDKELHYLRIGDLLSRSAETKRDKIAFVSEYENISKTFSELNSEVNQLSKGLYDLGLRRGDVVGLWGCNSYSWVQVQYACVRLGIVLCTVNPVYRGPELDYALRKGQIKALFMPGSGSKQEIVNKFQNVLIESLEITETTETDPLILKDVILLDGNSPPKHPKHNFKFHSIDSLFSNDGNIEKSILDEVSPEDPAIIMFTSGTTGKPKGAYSSHFTLVNNVKLCGANFHLDDDSVLLIPLPFFHSFAGVLGNISMTGLSFKAVIANLKYDVKCIVEAMIKHKCSHIIVTPTQVIDILDFLEKNSLQINSLNCVLIGGAPVPIEVAHRISKVIPSCTDVRIGYGATELGPCTTASHKNDSLVQRLETVGSPLDFVEVKIVNPMTGIITKIGEQGELLSRGHNVMIGYWRDQKKTEESIDKAKWYKSGDMAVMDENGFIKIIGRTKELIIRGGENIYPREVEELLHQHPDVLDAYVVGVPDERTGEEVCAWIQLKNKEVKVTEEEIRKFCKERISYFKVPKYVLFVDEFPMTSTGKAQKFMMRDKSCQILGLKEIIKR